MKIAVGISALLLGINVALARIPSFVVAHLAKPVTGDEEHSHPAPEKLGTVSFPVSCSPGIQPQFDHAVALLHSFAYPVAEKAFREILQADPTCVMAHWGAAMTYYHQLWEPSLTPAALRRGGEEIQLAHQIGGGTQREKEYIDALACIYRHADSMPYPTRALSYEKAMSMLAERNKADDEAQIFHALALLATSQPSDKNHGNQKRAAEILERLFRKYPEHPGVAHYLIHAYDSSELASRGLPAARAYAQIAPSAPHALHMPSHIFTRLGLWPDSIASNLASKNAAHQQGDIGEELHAMDYLMYAYLQCARDSEAARLLDELHAMHGLPYSEFKVGYAASAMPARFAVEQRKWSEAAKLEVLPRTPSHVTAVTLWARAVGLARAGTPAEAGPEIERLKEVLKQLQDTGDGYWVIQLEVQIREATAWAAHAEGRETEAMSLMRAAADREDATEKLPVTPGPIVPAREQLGDLLLELNRPVEALEAFEKALCVAPRRRGSLAGAARAAELAGNPQKAKRFRSELEQVSCASPADSSSPTTP